MIVFCLGNPRVLEDSLPVKLIPELQIQFPGMEFRDADPTESLEFDQNSIILDTVKGISQVTLFQNLEDFQKSRSLGVHDYDLYLDLTLRAKLGEAMVKIIGIPENYKFAAALSGVTRVLSGFI